ncbi:MAG: diaminopimelate epimerase [Elusimicrobia bacterium]|nr:diaminopimelate epimerase [Elusimicrobiota bacterium]
MTTIMPPRLRASPWGRLARTLRFCKMSAAGNDFVLLERKEAAKSSLAPGRLARLLCDRRHGIGADGLLLVDTGHVVPRLSYYNCDGSTAFCGNGTRSAALWLHRQGFTRGAGSFTFRSAAGPVQARVSPRGGTAAVRMPDPRDLRLDISLSLLGRRTTVHAVNTGVPHAVIVAPDVERLAVAEAGRALRRHPAFAPSGTNADFVSVGRKELFLRTYERGVEDETLACGTGAVAAAVVAHALGLVRPPVRVRIRGGAVLKVDFRLQGPSYAEVWLEGPARIVFTGEMKP